MGYRFKRHESVQDGLRRIATEQIDKAIQEIDEAESNPHTAVHQVRKRFKKLRGLIRLVRPALGKTYKLENAAFRSAARSISAIRDASTIIGTYDDLMDHFQSQVQRTTFGSIRSALTRQLHEFSDEQVTQRLADVRQNLVQSRVRVQNWKLRRVGFGAAAGGLAKTHARAIARLDDAMDDSNCEVLHQLRKRTKYHWYHVRLLRNVWPAMMRAYAGSLKELGESLGDAHDLAVLRARVLDSPDTFGSKTDIDAFVGLLQQRSQHLSATSLKDARRLFAESSEAFMERLKAYWKLWR